jgi:hypothetical protein
VIGFLLAPLADIDKLVDCAHHLRLAHAVTDRHGEQVDKKKAAPGEGWVIYYLRSQNVADAGQIIDHLDSFQSVYGSPAVTAIEKIPVAG